MIATNTACLDMGGEILVRVIFPLLQFHPQTPWPWRNHVGYFGQWLLGTGRFSPDGSASISVKEGVPGNSQDQCHNLPFVGETCHSGLVDNSFHLNLLMSLAYIFQNCQHSRMNSHQDFMRKAGKDATRKAKEGVQCMAQFSWIKSYCETILLILRSYLFVLRNYLVVLRNYILAQLGLRNWYFGTNWLYFATTSSHFATLLA